jgi:uncharacterized protein YjdB
MPCTVVRCITVPSFLLWLVACGDSGSTGPSNGYGVTTVASVAVTPSTVTLSSLGGTAQHTGTAHDARGNTISGKTFTWSSSDETVATVSVSGLVTVVENGMVTVTATVDGISGSAAVTVQQEASQLNVSPLGASAPKAQSLP